jgi:ribulose-5-phosphate 4-epimerase/fuculose-1-phosphate aldolase
VTIDEGYVKYQSHWSPGAAPDTAAAQLLEEWRKPLFAAGLVGHYDELNIGFGNLSTRSGEPGQFLITGTQTGHIEQTTVAHYSLVTSFDVGHNEVYCTGPVQASSEAMTHAALYALDPSIAAIVHVHSKPLWDRYLRKLPTSDSTVAYGTPEMAMELERLYRNSPFGSDGVAVMGGHEDGLISIGESIEQATTKILALAEHQQYNIS